MAAGEHQHEEHLMKFVEGPHQTPDYIRTTAKWLEQTYPVSFKKLRHRLLAAYKAAKKRT